MIVFIFNLFWYNSECVPPTISYHLCFLCISKVWSMLHQGSVGASSVQRMLLYVYIYFCCCCFPSKKLCFYHFHFSFWWSIKFPQQNIHQSETRIGDRKLWLELYVAQVSLTQWSILFFFDVPSLKLRNVIILPTDRPKIILPTAHITKN